MEQFEEIKKKYACNTSVDVVNEEGKSECVGVVTEAYQYDGLVVLAVWDAQEPLAWAMVYLGNGRVRHYDNEYSLVIREGELQDVDIKSDVRKP